MSKVRAFWSILSLCTVCIVLSLATPASAQVAISVSFGPPALPVYEQPICPGEGYIWAPGYWAWDEDDDDYYWVPGTWVMAPEVGYLWTPPWWGWSGGVYLFHAGYWGPHVGFYGGISYGFGYFGDGFVGGRWDHDHFYYNRSVTNVNVTNIRNVYNETIVRNNVTINHVSYNGGPGGIEARPRPQDEIAARERHLPPVSVQQQHLQTARGNPELRANENHGKPPIAATPRPTEFRGNGVVTARQAGGEYRSPANRGGGGPARTENQPTRGGTEGGNNRTPVHARELPPMQRPGPPNTGNSPRDQRYQQQQQKLYARQDQERQKLQQRQEQDHQRMQQRNADQGRQQQMEQRHQQQTSQLQQRHVDQQQHLQQRQEGKPHR